MIAVSGKYLCDVYNCQQDTLIIAAMESRIDFENNDCQDTFASIWTNQFYLASIMVNDDSSFISYGGFDSIVGRAHTADFLTFELHQPPASFSVPLCYECIRD